MGKVMIIGLDGLEPSLVTESMTNLAQREHGIIHIDVVPLQTPLIWAAFLTGHKDNGIHTNKASRYIGEKISRLFGFKNIEKIARITAQIGVNNLNIISKIDSNVVQQYTQDTLTHPTIFDLVEKSIALDIPAYNENPIYLTMRRNIAQAISGLYSQKDLIAEAWELFQQECHACLTKLEEEWELFMVHFFFTDVIGHLFWNNPEKIKGFYQMVDEKVGEITRGLPSSSLLIVSDHGIQGGLHTPQGFYSVNKQTQLSTPKITDFYEIIKKMLHHTYPFSQSPEHSETERKPNNHQKTKVLQHLKDLGYY